MLYSGIHLSGKELIEFGFNFFLIIRVVHQVTHFNKIIQRQLRYRIGVRFSIMLKRG